MSAAANPTLASIGRLEDRIEQAADAEMARIMARITGGTDGQQARVDLDAEPAVSETRPLASNEAVAAAADQAADEAAPNTVNYSTPWQGGAQVNSDRPELKRFEACEIDTSRVVTLDLAHPAVMEGRTIFPSTVHDLDESPRLLVSGHNSRKLGAVIEKGPWKGFPIYGLSLEERATCPRSCLRWGDCYGNAMHLARRHNHREEGFLPRLRDEVLALQAGHPDGFVIRLHVLGDFYSYEYVMFWADLFDEAPAMRIYGYTARREDADDAESRKIATAIRWLTEQAWDIFAIRFSGNAGPEGTLVFDEPSEHRHVIMCPSQTGSSEACATCALCWSPDEGVRAKTIGFLRHGMKRRRTLAELLRDAGPEGIGA